MILVDTSVWVDHLRSGDYTLSQVLEQGAACVHPMIIGELACGHLQNRSQLLELLSNLTQCICASHEETLRFLDTHKLMGKGIGWVDMHLLASTFLTPRCSFWTRDRRLFSVAQTLGIASLHT